MCGRYTLTTAPEELWQRFGLKGKASKLEPRYNIAPSQQVPVITEQHQGRQFQLMRWGLVPGWSDSPSVGYKLINARSETVHEKPSFRKAFRYRRCLVLADGFFEWRKSEDGKVRTPFYFQHKDGSPFAMAGLWELWRPQDEEEILSFTVLTRPACAPVTEVHQRMPVILNPEHEAAWLDPTLTHASDIQALIHGDHEILHSREVSSVVNSPKNDSPECIVAIEH